MRGKMAKTIRKMSDDMWKDLPVDERNRTSAKRAYKWNKRLYKEFKAEGGE